MKIARLVALALILTVSATFAGTVKSITLFVGDKAQPGEAMYTVFNVCDGDMNSFPIMFMGRPCIFSVLIDAVKTAQEKGVDQSERSRTVYFTLQDPSYRPGAEGSAPYLLSLRCPYTTERAEVFSGPDAKLAVKITENDK